MRFLVLFLLAILIAGCSSSSKTPTTPPEDRAAEVSFSQPYIENGSYFVDVNVSNLQALYQFSLRFDYNSDAIEPVEFEPSSEFGKAPLLMFEKNIEISDNLKSELRSRTHKLSTIAVSRPYPHLGDITAPHRLGRIKYKILSSTDEIPFTILKNPEYIVFRDHSRNRIEIKPAEPLSSEGGAG